MPEAPLRRLARKVRGAVQRHRGPEVVYRDGIPNRADEIVQGSATTQALIDAGFLTMGDYSYRAPRIRVFAGDTARVRIGRYTSVAEDVEVFVGGAHRTDWVSMYGIRAVFDLPGAYEDGTPTSNGDVEIGSDCWLARGATILSGVRIGDGAVVATHAVVTKDVRPFAVVAGNPAREIRRRFPDDQVDALLRIAWWDWPVERVIAEVESLCAADIAGFIARHDPSR